VGAKYFSGASLVVHSNNSFTGLMLQIHRNIIDPRIITHSAMLSILMACWVCSYLTEQGYYNGVRVFWFWNIGNTVLHSVGRYGGGLQFGPQVILNTLPLCLFWLCFNSTTNVLNIAKMGALSKVAGGWQL
jgi:hypothetical protein